MIASTDDSQQGREAFERRAWRDAYESLSRADAQSRLRAEDLELLAVSAYMLGRDDEAWTLLERAHHAYLEAAETLRAVRCAFWIGMNLALRGETGPAGGWLGRAHRLLERAGRDCPEHGYMLLPLVFQQEAGGDWEAAVATAAQAAELGERFGDDDLFALAAQLQGNCLLRHGRVRDGLALLDEAMVAATSAAKSPIVTGIVYCGVILACVETYEVRRAQEWTEVLTRWCEEQPDLVAFRSRCLIHRAELFQLRGDWPHALEEARRAEERLVEGPNRPATAQAFYRQGEVHRLRGDFGAAENAYRLANGYGFEPQPGFALLRLAQGRTDAAGASIRRMLGETTARPARAGLLPAAIEIFLALGDLRSARAACLELEAIAEQYGSALLAATAAHASGSVRLAEGDASNALGRLRRASHGWEELEAPYDAARTRVLLALACREVGDDDAAALELAAARETFAELGAQPDIARAAMLSGDRQAREVHGLTSRQLEVLRLVAAGSGNREIAAALVISEHTVARHLQNVFRKIDVSSRTAASTFAHDHGLL